MHPFAMLTVSRLHLIEAMNSCFKGKHRYKMGAKPRLGAKPESFVQTDCAGFVRWLLYACTNPKAKLDMGSWYQNQWCAKQNFKDAVYREVAGLKDSRLRIAFIAPGSMGKGSDGHVWLIINGQTIESYGGKGPGRRPWNNKTLLDNVTSCYVLTDVLV